MQIPLGKSFHRKVTGRTIKYVACEKCGARYAYGVERSAGGSGFSLFFLGNAEAKERAYEDAEKKVAKKLKDAVEPVPCVDCGWFQCDMVTEAYQRHRRWLFYVGLVILLLGVAVAWPVFAPRKDQVWPWWPGIPLLVIGGGLMLLREYSRRGYDVNQDEAAKQIWESKSSGTRWKGDTTRHPDAQRWVSGV